MFIYIWKNTVKHLLTRTNSIVFVPEITVFQMHLDQYYQEPCAKSASRLYSQCSHINMEEICEVRQHDCVARISVFVLDILVKICVLTC